MFNNSEIPISGYLHFQWLNAEILLKGSKEILTSVLWAHYWANRGVLRKKGVKFYLRPPLVLTTSLLAVSNGLPLPTPSRLSLPQAALIKLRLSELDLSKLLLLISLGQSLALIYFYHTG